MRSNTINYVAVGGFVIVMLVGLLISIALLSGRTGASDSYYAVYRNVTGVKFGTKVLYEGYPIGQVETVTPTPKEGKMLFHVDFTVTRGWRIPADSVAQIAAPGLLSAITISIHAGRDKTALEPGNRIASREAANIFAVMSSVASDISVLAEKNIKPLLATLNSTVGAFGSLVKGDVSVTVRELSTLLRDIAKRMPKIADNVDQFSRSMNNSSRQLGLLLKPKNRKKMEAFIANMDTAAGNFVRLSNDLKKTRGKLDQLLAATSTVVVDNKKSIGASINDLRHIVSSVARHIDSLNQNMEGTARNMYEFSRQIRQNPGLLLGGTPPRDDAARR